MEREPLPELVVGLWRLQYLKRVRARRVRMRRSRWQSPRHTARPAGDTALRPPTRCRDRSCSRRRPSRRAPRTPGRRSEEHTSELQSLTNLVCRLLLEKKNEENDTVQTI